ncbi:MAG: hypothetical protein AAGA12_10610 [Pseudomonadota bacterium]
MKRNQKQRNLLADVLEAKYDQDRARLNTAQKKVEDLQAQIDELAIARWTGEALAGDLNMMHYASAAEKWISAERARLNIELSQALAHRGSVEAELRRSFGRWHAFASLSEKLSDAERQIRRRRQVS